MFGTGTRASGLLARVGAWLRGVLVVPAEPGVAEDAVQRMRAMGFGEAEMRERFAQASMLAAAAASAELVQVVAKIAASGRITSEDLHQLRRFGIALAWEAPDDERMLRARLALDRVFGWRHLRRYGPMSEEWMDQLRDGIARWVLAAGGAPQQEPGGVDTATHWANGMPRLLTPEAYDRIRGGRGGE